MHKQKLSYLLELFYKMEHLAKIFLKRSLDLYFLRSLDLHDPAHRAILDVMVRIIRVYSSKSRIKQKKNKQINKIKKIKEKKKINKKSPKPPCLYIYIYYCFILHKIYMVIFAVLSDCTTYKHLAISSSVQPS